jgi:hypothetical protein
VFFAFISALSAVKNGKPLLIQKPEREIYPVTFLPFYLPAFQPCLLPIHYQVRLFSGLRFPVSVLLSNPLLKNACKCVFLGIAKNNGVEVEAHPVGLNFALKI